MLKNFSLLFLCLLFNSCQRVPSGENCTMSAQQDKHGSATPCVLENDLPPMEDTLTPPAMASEVQYVPTAATLWDADITYVNFSQEQQVKVEEAVALMKKVIGSASFKKRVLSHVFEGKKTFFDNGGLTNAQIYRIILDGAEKVGVTSKNNRMDVVLELYHATTNTIGYTYPNVTKIWMNTKYFDRYTPVQVAGNLTHEWMHKLGFAHATTWSKSRDHSVPYAIGYIMEELAKEHYLQ